MKQEKLKEIMHEQFDHCMDMMTRKSEEYTQESDDKLEHFKAAAALMGITPAAALMGMLSKHLVSVADMCMDPRGSLAYSMERWSEKITDSMNYMFLLKAIIKEEYQTWAEVEEEARNEERL